MINGLMGNRKEEAFTSRLLAATRVGDVAWDIGAFRGWFTMRLSQAVGPEGRVFSFEPNPESHAIVQEKAATRTNITVLPVAVGNSSAMVAVARQGARSRVTDDPAAAEAAFVRMASGDALIAAGEAAQPAVLKIDAEGLEYDILKGLARTLASPTLRSIFMEVHFRLLEERHGSEDIPARVIALLKSHGFRTRWVGPSHLVAQRGDT
jgi:FkbM family methyltransferase